MKEKYLVYNQKTKQKDYMFFKLHNAEERASTLNAWKRIKGETFPATEDWIVKEI